MQVDQKENREITFEQWWNELSTLEERRDLLLELTEHREGRGVYGNGPSYSFTNMKRYVDTWVPGSSKDVERLWQDTVLPAFQVMASFVNGPTGSKGLALTRVSDNMALSSGNDFSCEHTYSPHARRFQSIEAINNLLDEHNLMIVNPEILQELAA